MMRSALVTAFVVLLLASPFTVNRTAPLPRQGKSLAAAVGPIFVENRGQRPAGVKFHAFGGMAADFLGDGVDLGAGTAAVALRFEEAAPVDPVGEEPASTSVNVYSRDNEASLASAFGRLRYAGLYDGIDVVFRRGDSGLEYDLLCAPGSAPERVVIGTDARALTIAGDGALLLEADGGTLRQPAPVAWQTGVDGARLPVACAFRKIDERRFGFRVEGRDPRLALTVDPGVEWITGVQVVVGPNLSTLTTDANGNIVFVGQTADPVNANGFAIIGSANANASTLLWLTLFPISLTPSGYASDVLNYVAVAPSGDVLVTSSSVGIPFLTPGTTFCSNPLSFPGQTPMLLRLSGGGTLLAVEMLPFGGPMALGPSGEIWLAGHVITANAPVSAGAFDPSFGGPSDTCVLEINPAMTLIWYCSYLGGSGDELPHSIAVTPWGDAVVGGFTTSPDLRPGWLPPAAYSVSPAPLHWSGFVALVHPAAGGFSDLVNITFLGDPIFSDCMAVAVDSLGYITASGFVSSQWPLVGPIGAWGGATLNNLTGVIRFNPTLSAIDYSATIANAAIHRVVLDESGGAILVGQVYPSPTALVPLQTTAGSMVVPPWPANAPTPCPNLGSVGLDGCIIRINPSGTKVLYASKFGWEYDDWLQWACLGPSSLLVSGMATTAGSSAWSTTPGTFGAGTTTGSFLAQLDMLPTGVTKVGTCSPPGMPASMGLNPMPVAGSNADVYLASSSSWWSPPPHNGLLVIGAGTSSATTIAGITVYVNLLGTWVAQPITTDARGHHSQSALMPPGWTGVTHTLQYVLNDPSGLRASHGLTFTIQ